MLNFPGLSCQSKDQPSTLKLLLFLQMYSKIICADYYEIYLNIYTFTVEITFPFPPQAYLLQGSNNN